ncbi:MAG TPA: hypothetical protein VMV01_11845 [Planctomycetota bacterium]|nr:hypothetical protein [Planctomycetota bacterium]
MKPRGQQRAGMDFDLAAGTAVLQRTPGCLRALLAGLPPAWTDAAEGPDTWATRRGC